MVWKHSFQISFGLFFLISIFSVPAQGAVPDLYEKSVDEDSRLQISKSYGKVPLQFESNEGQAV